MANAHTKYLYAGGDYDHRASVQDARGGLMRIAPDGGAWEPLTQGLPDNVEARALAIHPVDRDVLFVGTQDGPYRSTDGGLTWSRPGFPERGVAIYSVAFHPQRPNVLFAGADPTLYRSEDGGDTWRAVPGARPAGHCEMTFPPRAITIAFDPSRPDDVYVAYEIGGIIRSGDGGETFSDVSTSLIRLADEPRLKNRSESQTDAEGLLDSHVVVVSAAAPGTPFLGNRMGIFRGEERGAAWRDVDVGRFSPLTYCRSIAVSAQDPKRLYATLSPAARSVDGSLWRSDDLGGTWRRFDHGVKADATMTGVAVDRDDAKRVYCISRSGQLFATHDEGASWREHRMPRGVMQRVRFLACS